MLHTLGHWPQKPLSIIIHRMHCMLRPGAMKVDRTLPVEGKTRRERFKNCRAGSRQLYSGDTKHVTWRRKSSSFGLVVQFVLLSVSKTERLLWTAFGDGVEEEFPFNRKRPVNIWTNRLWTLNLSFLPVWISCLNWRSCCPQPGNFTGKPWLNFSWIMALSAELWLSSDRGD